jgi:hypothetical protein
VQAWPPDVVESPFIRVNPFAFDPAQARAALCTFMEEAVAKQSRFVVSHERLSGAPMQGGVDAREIADRLYATFPDGRVLIVVRRQPEMLASVYKQITTRGLNRDSYDHFLANRVMTGRYSPVLGFLEYHHLIGYYRERFGADRVLVLAYEMLLADPTDFVGRIAEFAGMDRPAHVPTTKENVGLPTAAIAALRYLNIAARLVGVDRWLVGPRAKPKIVNARLKLVRRIGRFAPAATSRRIEETWSAKTEAFLADRLAASNRLTAEMSGIDLAALGYVTTSAGD